MQEFSCDDVPNAAAARWFVRCGDEIIRDRGFRSKSDAGDWIRNLGHRLDWQVGFKFRLRGDKRDFAIVDRNGNMPKI